MNRYDLLITGLFLGTWLIAAACGTGYLIAKQHERLSATMEAACTSY